MKYLMSINNTDQKKRVDCSRKLLKKFKNCDDTRVISNLLTCDETWVSSHRGGQTLSRGKVRNKNVFFSLLKKKIFQEI